MSDVNDTLKAEFDQWALDGRGQQMESCHGSTAGQTLARMALKPGDRVLDLGCGTGWVTRLLASSVEGGQGMAVGQDISDEMIAQSRAASSHLENILFVPAPAEEIPWRDEYFESVLSIESFHFFPDQEAVLRELYRVLVPGGALFLLISLYHENPHSLRSVNLFKVPVHARPQAHYEQMLRAQGFTGIEISHIPDLTEVPVDYRADWFDDAEELRQFKQVGALLLVARKPE
jgi:ubiquinone/menaquinone biosynthesis C-methylase UbiE